MREKHADSCSLITVWWTLQFQHNKGLIFHVWFARVQNCSCDKCFGARSCCEERKNESVSFQTRPLMSWMLEDVELLRPAGLHPPSLVLSGQEVALWREDSCVRSPSLQASQLPRWSIIPGSWQMLPLSRFHSFCSLTAKNKNSFKLRRVWKFSYF